jgi:uncharacterized lipoprotein YmbA
MRSLPWLLALVVLVGCGSSPPTRFYALDAVKPERPAASGTAVTPLKVDAVHIPPLLDRRSIVRREAGNQLDISSQDRWGASFGEMMLGVLTQDLQSRLPMGAVIPSRAPAPPDARGLVVDILSFVPNGSGEVELTCDWSFLEGAPAHPVLMRTTHLTQQAAETSPGQARAMSELVGKLADQIAAAASKGLDSTAAHR